MKKNKNKKKQEERDRERGGNAAGADPGIFYWGEGGGGPHFGSERTVEL